MAKSWTASRRMRHAEAIRRWRPWERSTELQTAEGKARASRNADRGGHRGDFRNVVKVLTGVSANNVKRLSRLTPISVSRSRCRCGCSGRDHTD
jgi:hypothetical protein